MFYRFEFSQSEFGYVSRSEFNLDYNCAEIPIRSELIFYVLNFTTLLINMKLHRNLIQLKITLVSLTTRKLEIRTKISFSTMKDYRMVEMLSKKKVILPYCVKGY